MLRLSQDPSYYMPKNTREWRMVAGMKRIAADNGLDLRKWRFGFFNGTRTLGQCRRYICPRTRKLTHYVLISRRLLSLHTDSSAVINEVKKHEIAHALAYEENGRLDHCMVWRRWCHKLGVVARLEIPADEMEPTCRKARRREAQGAKWILKCGDVIVDEYKRYPPRVAENLPLYYLKKDRAGTLGTFELVQVR